MKNQKKSLLDTILILSIFLFPPAALQCEAGQPGKGKRPPGASFSSSYTPVYQFDTDLDDGGQFGVNRHFVRLNILQSVGQKTFVGLGIGYDFEDWKFKDVAAVAGGSAWDTIHRPSLAIPLMYQATANSRVGLTPSVQFSGEAGAAFGDALMYGVSGVYIYSVNKDLSLGIGAGAFERLEEFSFFPYLVIDWKISEQFRITNPFRAGPAGPAGLELIYSPSPLWKIGVGGAYRSYRFRLENENRIANGIGENNMLTGFARIQRQIGPKMSIDLSGGMFFYGRLSVEDHRGSTIDSTDYATAPFVALTFAGKL